jgi:hypothetical protein
MGPGGAPERPDSLLPHRADSGHLKMTAIVMYSATGTRERAAVHTVFERGRVGPEGPNE